MKIIDADSDLGKGPDESKKRKREWLLISILGLGFLILSGIAFRMFGYSRDLPFEYSIFFFGLVNFNIILFLLLTFLIFRNIVKVFAEKRGGLTGSSLKAKLIAAFVAFSFVPTALMFLVSVFYINNSFDKWFSEKTAAVLKSSLEVTNSYYVTAKKKNYHFAKEVAQRVARQPNKKAITQELKKSLNDYRLDSIEFYPAMLEKPISLSSNDINIDRIPEVAQEFKQKGIVERAESSMIHHFDEGNLVRVIVPATYKGQEGAIVVSSFIPLSLISRMDDIAEAYEDFKDSNPLSYPLKSIYLIILVLMTLVILLGATWFGFYLARQLSIPLEAIGKAAKKVAKGEYLKVNISSGSPEIQHLVEDFNQMSENLEKSAHELDEHSRYIEVVLANVTTGVVSVDKRGYITMVNEHAAKLLDIDPKKYVGNKVVDVLTDKYFETFAGLLSSLKQHNADSIQKEIRVSVNGRTVPLQMSLSILRDEKKNEIGKILVFDDLTMVVSAQRAAAWNEVARRIAHEIKNPLTPISLSAQRLQKKFSADISDPAFTDCTSMIINQVDGLKKLVNEFSNFARMPKSKPTTNNLNIAIKESLVLFEQAHKSIIFSHELDTQLPSFLFDKEQIQRALTNLLDNSISAVNNQENAKVSVSTSFNPLLNLVRLIVEDNGQGIEGGLVDRVFEPYVTTKSHGTGLGLAIVKRTVEDHNGFIRAFPGEGKGTRIVVELPVIFADSSTWVKKVDADTKNVNINENVDKTPNS